MMAGVRAHDTANKEHSTGRMPMQNRVVWKRTGPQGEAA
jgi:hypothetical protein